MEDEVAAEFGTGQGASASVSSPPSASANALNPLELDLILETVLEHMNGKSTLLKCRLLNHQWNEKALGILRGKKALLELNSGNVAEYLRHVRRTGQTETNLNLSLTVGRRGGDLGLDQQALFMEIDELFSHFNQAAETDTKEGVHFVEVLSCTSNYLKDLDWIAIAALIDRVAPGLRRLHLREGVYNQLIEILHLRPSTEFPHLETISFGAILKNKILLPQILNKAPNMTQLEIHVEPLDRHNPRHFCFLGQNLALAFNSIISTTGLEGLTELSTPLDSHETYLALTRLRFPCLEKLRLTLTVNADPNSSASLARFLASNCPKLYSLEFDFMPVTVVVILPDDPLITEIPGPLPPLPNITHFAYGVSRLLKQGQRSSPPMVRLDNLRPKSFPGLRSATVKFGTFLFGSEEFPNIELLDWVGRRGLINNVAFPSVGHLHLKLYELSRVSHEQMQTPGLHLVTPRDVCNQLFMLFPNTRHLHLDIQLGISMEYVDQFRITARFLLQEFAGLESLEINSNCFNFLTRIITDEIQGSTLQHSLKKLRIPQVGRQAEQIMVGLDECPTSSDGGNCLVVPERTEHLLRLMSILEWFKSLERLTISQKLVDGENLTELEANYPNVKIVVVEEK